MKKATHEATQSSERPIAGILTRKVVEEFTPVSRDEAGLSFGQLIDAQLHEAAQKGEIVQEIALHFELADWLEFANACQAHNNEWNRE